MVSLGIHPLFFHWYSFASLGIDPAFMTTFGPPKPRNGAVSCIPGTPQTLYLVETPSRPMADHRAPATRSESIGGGGGERPGWSGAGGAVQAPAAWARQARAGWMRW